MFTTALLLTATLAAAQHGPHHCETPPVWSAEILSRIDDKHDDRSSHFGIKQKFFQDAEHARVASYDVEEEGREKREHYEQRIYLFHHEEHRPEGGVEFRINLKDKSCTRHDLDDEFRPVEIPHNATHLSQQYIGASGVREGSVLTNHFGIEHEDHDSEARWEGEFTDREVGCFPVTETFEEKSKDHDGEHEVRAHTQYYNIVLGISDPSVFEIPEECEHHE